MTTRRNFLAGGTATSANFLFYHGPDAFIFVNFMRPDAAKIDAMLAESEGARHTFFVLHSPIGPYDGWGAYWFLFGKPADAEKRRALQAPPGSRQGAEDVSQLRGDDQARRGGQA